MTQAGRRKSRAPDEQIESAVGAILADLVARVPGARAAALVDPDGETVDYAGCVDAFGVRVAAAHLRIVMGDATRSVGDARLRSLVVRTTRSAFAIISLPEGYAITLVLSPWARRTGHERAISATVRKLADEVGWNIGREPVWRAVDVVESHSGRPLRLRLGGELPSLDVIGRYSAGWRRRGWRVRLSNGVEAMLVREPGDFWYLDEAPVAVDPEKKRAPKEK
jgi:predicted regulator of Ras-like GTPase activity (Roadblock/LC7/MglB family)